MHTPSRPSSLGIGLAIFSMFFGAGNSIFPLYVGFISQSNWLIACFGLLLTAVLMPVLGIVGMLRSGGQPLHFFGRIGKIPGLIVAFFVISLLGPFGSTPRCIALAYATLVDEGSISMPFFGLLACILLFLCSLKKQYILPLIGYVLTPVLLLSLICIISFGLSEIPSLSFEKNGDVFLFGLLEGYKTMDLLAAFFFSSTILHLLQSQKDHSSLAHKDELSLLLRGGVIGGGLLGIIYVGFCCVAGIHAMALEGVLQEQLLARIVALLLGDRASFIVKITIVVACLTTAIALITAFVDFLQTEIIGKRIPYPILLACALSVTYGIAIFEFTQISKILSPVLYLIYPGLILLTFINCFARATKKTMRNEAL